MMEKITHLELKIRRKHWQSTGDVLTAGLNYESIRIIAEYQNRVNINYLQ